MHCTLSMLSDFLTLKKVTVGSDFKHQSSVRVRLARFLMKKSVFYDKTSGTDKVRNSGLGPDPDLSAKSGPE